MSELNLLYLHSTSMGYGRMGVNLARELERMGVTVYDRLEGAHEADNASFATYVGDHLAGPKPGRSKVCVWVTVPPHARGWFADQIPCIYTMYETNSLPEGFVEAMHNFDTIIVPSPQNLEMFSQHHPNVHYVPLGIDPYRWRVRERIQPGAQFNFLLCGSGQRKGEDLAYQAFAKVFHNWPADRFPIPHLILKGRGRAHYYGARIDNVTGTLSDEDEVALYRTAHCYLGPTRGEGFGLQPLQAIAQGCPTILTAAHGQESYASLGIPLDSKLVPAGYFIYGESGEWWEPDFDQLCEAMWDVYTNWSEHEHRAALNGEVAGGEFTWDRSALGLLNAIGRDRLGPYTGSGEWFTPPAKLYQIVTNRDFAHEVANRFLTYRAGKIYYDTADVKRILFEASILDPVCLDDGGLAPEQIPNLERYRADHENCLFCGQSLAKVNA